MNMTTLLLGLSPVSWIVFGFLALVAAAGVVAVASPQGFAKLARGGGRWVDTKELLEKLDKPVDIDRVAFGHSRMFGVVVLAAVGVLAYVYWAYLL